MSDLGNSTDSAGDERCPRSCRLPEHGGYSFGAAGQHEKRRGPNQSGNSSLGSGPSNARAFRFKSSDLALQSPAWPLRSEDSGI